MMHTIFLALALAASTPDAGTVATKPAPMAPEVKSLVDRMQAFYEKTQDFTAGFRQDYAYKTFARVNTSSGVVSYQKAKNKTTDPMRMRWEYEKPGKKTFLLSGDKVYFHDPDAATLTIGAISTDQLSASVTFLWGQGKLEDEFAITKVACDKCAGTKLQLEPFKPDPRFQRVFLEIDPKSATVVKSTVIDPEGNSNAISFTSLSTNVGLANKDGGVPDIFRLSPPPGTQVVDTTKLKAPQQ